MDITLNNYLFSHMYFQYEFNLFMIMINCIDCASPHLFETATPPPHCNSAMKKGRRRGGIIPPILAVAILNCHAHPLPYCREYMSYFLGKIQIPGLLN